MGIFVSYRRDDTAGFAGRLYDDLVERLPDARIFMDVDAIEPGQDFVEAIDRAVGDSGVVLVLIGPRWLQAADAAGSRRIDNELDYVRLEIEGGLESGKRVIPVLVQGAAIPRGADLPESLRPLARRQAVELTHARWRSDLAALVETITAAPPEQPRAAAIPAPAGGAPEPARRTISSTSRPARIASLPLATLAGALLLVVALIGGGSYLGWLATGLSSPTPPAGGVGAAGDPSPTTWTAAPDGSSPPPSPSPAPSPTSEASASSAPATGGAGQPSPATPRPPRPTPTPTPTKKAPPPTPTPTASGGPMSAFGVPCTIWGTAGSDQGSGIVGTSGDDVICGLGGNDLIVGNGGADRIDGGGGTDRVGYQNASGGVTVNLATGVVSGAAGADRLASIEGVMDSTHDDTLVGTAGADYFWLHGGADSVTGGGGTDAVDYTYAAAGECADDTLDGIEETYPTGACG